jgi:hypothetical protein
MPQSFSHGIEALHFIQAQAPRIALRSNPVDAPGGRPARIRESGVLPTL